MLNVFTFEGNIGKDAAIRYTQQGTPVASFSVPAKKGYGQNEKTTWVRCNLWGKRAESLAERLVKGTLVGVTGELFVSEWEKDGQKNFSVEVDAKDVSFLKSPNTQNQQPGNPGEFDERGVPQNPYGGVGDDTPF